MMFVEEDDVTLLTDKSEILLAPPAPLPTSQRRETKIHTFNRTLPSHVVKSVVKFHIYFQDWLMHKRVLQSNLIELVNPVYLI